VPLGVVVALFVLAALCAGAWAYDSSRDDLIAKGVVVGGVDVGGLRADAAALKLRRQLQQRLERPVRVAVAGRRFRLTDERSQLTVDVAGMVDAAIDESRSGGLPGRLWRNLRGNRVDAELSPLVTYSKPAVRRFVRRVARAVDRPARDARVDFSTTALPAVPSRTGLRLRTARLQRAVTAALGGVGESRRVRGRVAVVQPKVKTSQLAKKYPHVITVDRPSFRLRYFKRLRLADSYKIAVGMVGLETPAGLYHVQNKAINPAWSVPNKPWAGELAGRVIPGGTAENPLKSRWLGIYDGAGIHGTDAISSLGTAASHGCIRMAIPDVEELYDRVPVQTPVYIQ